MADAIVITIKNFEQIKRAFKKAPRITEHHLQNAVVAGLAEIQKKALRPVIPWDTGRLLQSIGEGTTIGRLQGSIGPTAEYAIYVNRRRHKTGGKDFVGQWAKKSEKKVQDRFNKAARNIARDIARKI